MSPQNVRRNANHVNVDILTWHSNGQIEPITVKNPWIYGFGGVPTLKFGHSQGRAMAIAQLSLCPVIQLF